jgi:hypothetical protein
MADTIAAEGRRPPVDWRARIVHSHLQHRVARLRVSDAVIRDRSLDTARGFLRAAAAHPIGSALAVGALTVGITVTVTAAGSPSVATGLPHTGTVSLESADAAGRFIMIGGEFGTLAPVRTDDEEAARRAATFEVVPGLADPACFSMRTADERYLRHSSWRLRPSPDEGTALFRGDATFCARKGSAADSIALESANYPGWFLRHVGDDLWVDRSDGTAAFLADSSFLVRTPLA